MSFKLHAAPLPPVAYEHRFVASLLHAIVRQEIEDYNRAVDDTLRTSVDLPELLAQDFMAWRRAP